LAIGIAAMLKAGAITKDAGYFSPASLPAHFSLTWAWFSLPLGWNSPTWSLSVEFAGYLVFPFALGGLRRVPRPLQIAILMLSLAGQVALLSETEFPSTGPLALLRGAFGLGIGMLLRLIIGDRVVAGAGAAGIALVAALAFGQPGIAALCSSYLIIALARAERSATGRLMTMAFPAWLGRVSFSIYLLHVPLLLVFLQIIRRAPLLQTPSGLAIFAASYLIAVLVASGIAWRMIERPGQHAFRAILA
jgi:peptidoglycan/LPS O-acetylase OafA/YrhL